ncbi:hypothetical protein METBIDRAFT_208595 [Metschnikowia bicuspidata var. bicuspidata NRRL YB-4993]|uniref:Uncharacterized protein n=1 Tax=Metschnikowia bicuspidata var. bicuspidata NRRL YB-4993 TaxID=869754 RepID=A0A1A0H776_9ASCO|nr:hypothetical protein METBIDRAFT_208595 [Metschnikowia bicuspidata var. bicuspidata NRRL YB-4993]OBA19830.1 hypothetical protein METBIDRAFT_208595 [Metschnikowia bicuspidata var. bicuspidata NRRL YB-4993]
MSRSRSTGSSSRYRRGSHDLLLAKRVEFLFNPHVIYGGPDIPPRHKHNICMRMADIFFLLICLASVFRDFSFCLCAYEPPEAKIWPRSV